MPSNAAPITSIPRFMPWRPPAELQPRHLGNGAGTLGTRRASPGADTAAAEGVMGLPMASPIPARPRGATADLAPVRLAGALVLDVSTD
jgi:hypothetical protein